MHYVNDGVITFGTMQHLWQFGNEPRPSICIDSSSIKLKLYLRFQQTPVMAGTVFK